MPKGGLPNGVIIAAIVAVAILATSFSGFKPTAFATAVASCTNINAAGSYQLSGNLFSTSTCINITSPNTELDCNNFWINDTSAADQSSIAINVTNVNNVSVHNCRISGYGGSGATVYEGQIAAINSTNVSIFDNNLLNTSGYASLSIQSSNYTIVANNTILNTVGSARGVYINARFWSWADNNTIRNNTIRNTVGNAIEIDGNGAAQAKNNIIENNTIEYISTNAILFTGTASMYASNTTISSNIIRHVVGSAMRVNRISNITIKFNTIYNTSVDGIRFQQQTVGNNTIFGNTIYNTTLTGINFVQGNGDTIYNNTIFNNSDGIVSTSSSGTTNITIYNNTIRNNTDTGGQGGYAVYILGLDGSYSNVSNNTLEGNNYGVYVDDDNRNNITGNFFRYNRRYSIQFATSTNNYNTNITGNTICYNNATLENTTNRYTMYNNSFCADPVAPTNNALFSDVTAFTVNVTNTFNTTSAYPTSCSLFVNGAQVATNTTVKEKTNVTFVYTPTASGNWYVFCNDTAPLGPNTANGTLFLLSAAAAPPSSGGGSSGGEVKLPPTPKVKDFTLSAVNSIIQIFLGKSASNSLLIENTGEEDLVFSTLTVTGVDTSWLSLPSSLPTVLAGSSATLDIGITVPKDAQPKLYTAHASATASGITKSTSFDVRVEAACDGCFQVKLKDPILNASRGNPVYTQLTITNVGNVELTAALSATGETRSWMLFSQDSMAIPAGQEQSQTIEITPTVSEKGIYPINITVSSGTKTEQVVLLINLQPGCPVCPASQSSGACVNGKQQLTSYVCSEQTNLQCQPVAQEVSCALVKKKKLLLPFWEAPLEHVEANWWWIILILIAYAGYRYYKKRQATNKDQS